MSEVDRLLASCRVSIASILADYHEELDELATMRDVDDCLLMTFGDQSRIGEQLRAEQWERRHVARRVGNVVWARFRGGER